ncbi:MAG: hypothetical protein J3K34DRAFT_401484 [Monoraphidium minutum]|nr:MAG: hypothetical protein J3K34DRAFT_401484 [Monoraphidium minutum]
MLGCARTCHRARAALSSSGAAHIAARLRRRRRCRRGVPAPREQSARARHDFAPFGPRRPPERPAAPRARHPRAPLARPPGTARKPGPNRTPPHRAPSVVGARDFAARSSTHFTAPTPSFPTRRRFIHPLIPFSAFPSRPRKAPARATRLCSHAARRGAAAMRFAPLQRTCIPLPLQALPVSLGPLHWWRVCAHICARG